MKMSVWWIAGAPALVIACFFGVRSTAVGASAAPMAMPADDFATDNARAMDKMMAAMAVESTGNTDRDFVATMVPHHQGAIDMALAELRYGKDETLRRMAQEIIVEQRQEIDAMKLATDRLAGSKVAAPDHADVCKSKPLSQSAPDARPPKGQ